MRQRLNQPKADVRETIRAASNPQPSPKDAMLTRRSTRSNRHIAPDRRVAAGDRVNLTLHLIEDFGHRPGA
jgi:hypothetical protein